MARKILSFEEYSAKVNAPQVDETELEDVAQDDVEEVETEETEDVESDEESDEEVEDIEDEEDDDDDDEDDDDDDDDDDDEIDENAEEQGETQEVDVKTVSEMLGEAYESCVAEACAYENDDYDDHTVEGYMKENAALAAGLAAKAMEEAYNEVKEGEMTVEMYEAHCNSMKEAYAKKIEELKEAWGK